MPKFEISKSANINATPEKVHALINDFHHWVDWSPWEGVDPDLTRTYTGPSAGVGASYSWEGNRKAGAGSMTITESTPQRILLDLDFVKPFEAHNVTTFALTPAGAGTHLTWTMTGTRNVAMSVMGKLFFDRLLGKDFDKGLANLKAAAETS